MTERSSEELAVALENATRTDLTQNGRTYTVLQAPSPTALDAAAEIRRLRSQSLINMDRAVEAEDELRRLSARCAALEQEYERLKADMDDLIANGIVVVDDDDDSVPFTPSEEPQR